MVQALKNDRRWGTSKDRAAPLGMTVKTKIERGDRYSAPEIYNLEITVLEVLRGKGTQKLKRSEGASEPDLKTGFEPLFVHIRFGYFSKGRGFGQLNEPYEIPERGFVAVSGDGKTEYKPLLLLSQPQPRLIHMVISPGEIKEGWVALQVPEKQNESFLIFKRDYNKNSYGFWGPVWFRL